MPFLFSTTGTAEHERFECWRETVSNTFVPVRCEPTAATVGFTGRLRSLSMGDVQATEVAVTPHHVRRTQRLITSGDGDYVKFSLQLDGDCLLTQDDRQVLLSPGDLVLYDTTRPYSLRLGEAYRGLVLLIPRHRLLLTRSQTTDLAARTLTGPGHFNALLSGLLRPLSDHLHEFDDGRDAGIGDHLVDLVNSLLARCAGISHGHPGIGCSALRAEIEIFIQQHLHNPELRPGLIAAAHHISLRQLHKIFEQNDDTVGELIRRQRLQRCQQDLQDPRLARFTVSQIGARWGLPIPSSFSRAFRAKYGLTPRDCRSASLHRSRDLRRPETLSSGRTRPEGQGQNARRH